MTMTREELQRRPPMGHDDIRAALEAATPGPWHAWDRGIGSEVHQGQDGTHEGWPIDRPCSPLNDEFRETFRKSDAHLIANAPTYIADLLAEVDRLTSAVHMYADKLAEHECEAAAVAELGVALEETSNNAADYFDRALAAEQAVERVRDYAAYLSTLAGGDRHYASGILRALDGGERR